MTTAIAYRHGPARVMALAQAFANGCARHGVECVMRDVHPSVTAEEADVVWMYGLGPALPVFNAYEGRALRVIGDIGYWRELMPHVVPTKRYVRIALDGQQPDAHLQRRRHAPDRFNALQLGVGGHAARMQLKVEPVAHRGRAILVCGCSEVDAARNGFAYGEWETAIVKRLQALTDRPIVIREKPKNAPIVVRGARRCTERECWKAIRSSWAVVCRSGNIGADALLHGVPVWAERGPGAVYGLRSLDHIAHAEAPAAEDRINALADIAYWQWTGEEMAQGKLMQHLENEGLI